jgi:hypothetical protein
MHIGQHQNVIAPDARFDAGPSQTRISVYSVTNRGNDLSGPEDLGDNGA